MVVGEGGAGCNTEHGGCVINRPFEGEKEIKERTYDVALFELGILERIKNTQSANMKTIYRPGRPHTLINHEVLISGSASLAHAAPPPEMYLTFCFEFRGQAIQISADYQGKTNTNNSLASKTTSEGMFTSSASN